jgi:hypothetical protein
MSKGSISIKKNQTSEKGIRNKEEEEEEDYDFTVSVEIVPYSEDGIYVNVTHHAIKMYWGMEIQLHTLFTSANRQKSVFSFMPRDSTGAISVTFISDWNNFHQSLCHGYFKRR